MQGAEKRAGQQKMAEESEDADGGKAECGDYPGADGREH